MAAADTTREPATQNALEAPIGGEVRIGQGRAPAFLRWFNYAIYLAAIAYLAVFWPDTGLHPAVIIFAGVLSVWLAYVVIGRKPPEP